MRLGVCCRPDAEKAVLDAGFDFMEWPGAEVLSPESSRWLPPAHGLPVETLNLFLRGVRLIGPEATPHTELETYATLMCERACALGVSVIVLGGSLARRIPDGFPQAAAERQLEAFLQICAHAAESFGVVIALEPICHRECNFILTVEEAAWWVNKVARPGLRLLADTYHMEVQGEPLNLLRTYGSLLAHVHTADSDRCAPGAGSFAFEVLAQELRLGGYNGRISIECVWEDMTSQLPAAYSRLAAAFGR